MISVRRSRSTAWFAERGSAKGRLLRTVLVAGAVVVAALWLGSAGQDVPSGAPGGIPADAQRATVAHVVDGDTVRVTVVDGDGTLPPGEHRVRLLGIDSPEMEATSGLPECGAVQATEYLHRRIPPGTSVWLVPDTEDRDRFDRPLRYVLTDDASLINQAAVAAGHARAMLFEPNDRYADVLRATEDAARADAAGMWAACAPG